MILQILMTMNSYGVESIECLRSWWLFIQCKKKCKDSELMKCKGSPKAIDQK